MAPIKKPRPRARASVPSKSKSNLPPTQAGDNKAPGFGMVDTPFATFPSNKREKQSMRRSALLNRISKTAPGNTSGKKRRRRQKTLSTNLEGLLGALPEVTGQSRARKDAGEEADDEWQGISSDTEGDNAMKMSEHRAALKTLDVKGRSQKPAPGIEMKSMKVRPGSTRRKMRLERSEQDRFARNMAQMADTRGSETQEASEKWAALRGFIERNVEQSPLFKKE